LPVQGKSIPCQNNLTDHIEQMKSMTLQTPLLVRWLSAQ